MGLKGKAMIAAAFVVLALVVYYADPARVAGAIADADPVFVLAALGISSVGLVLRVLKWSVIVGIGARKLASVQLLGMTISHFTPGKMAEPVKAVILKMRYDRAVSESLPSVIWERVLDVISLMILSLFAFASLTLSPTMRLFSYFGLGVFAVIIVLALVVLHSKRFGMFVFRAAARLPVAGKYFARISGSFVESFYSIRISKARLLASFLITFTAWVLEGVAFYFVFLALGLPPHGFLVLAGLLSLSTLISVASSLPGGIGSYEVVASALLVLLGLTSQTAITAVFLFRLTSFWYSIMFGAVSFIYLARKIDLKGAMSKL